MKLSNLVVTSLFSVANAATARRVGNATAIPNLGNDGDNKDEKSRVLINFARGGKKPTQAPTTSPAPSMCIGNTVGWVDLFGDGCYLYEAYDLPGCPYYGSLWDGGMGVADDNCCYCAGTGAPSPPFQWPTYSPTVTQAPTTSPAPSMCTGNTVGWVGLFGEGCDWYEAYDLPGCPWYGSFSDGDMGVADDNCCYCAGTGAPSPPFQWPTYSPTVTQAPTTSPAPSMCTGNTVGWVDAFGNGCDLYEAYDLPGCPWYGSLWDGDMGVADDNCCYCAGTGAPSPPFQWPTYTPVTQAPTTSAAPSCIDTPGWVDIDGDGCDWYEAYDLPGCPYEGSSYEGGMGVADDNCCYCAGIGVKWPTYRPTSSSPTSSPSTSKPTTTPSTRTPTTSRPSTRSPTSSPTSRPSTRTPTSSPTAAPSTRTPTTSRPSTRSPTSSPTSRPSTSKPTTSGPSTRTPTTSRPSTRPPTSSPSTRRPTSRPSTRSPTKKPGLFRF